MRNASQRRLWHGEEIVFEPAYCSRAFLWWLYGLSTAAFLHQQERVHYSPASFTHWFAAVDRDISPATSFTSNTGTAPQRFWAPGGGRPHLLGMENHVHSGAVVLRALIRREEACAIYPRRGDVLPSALPEAGWTQR